MVKVPSLLAGPFLSVFDVIIRRIAPYASQLRIAKRDIAFLEKRLEEALQQQESLKNTLEKIEKETMPFINYLHEKLDTSEKRRLALLQKISEIHDLAGKDPLTDLLNRRGFEIAMHRQISVIQRYTKQNNLPFYPPYVILLDLDGFKTVNDIYGHPEGDKALLTVTEILNSVFHRDTDIVCRLGGDEFIVCLTDVTEIQVRKLGNDLQEKIRQEKKIHFDEQRVTISIGAALVPILQNTLPHEMNTIFREAMEAADRAMYHSKNVGKDTGTIVIGDTFHAL
jgi:diguanylate cyclase (GGDEF)-like protein